jgi:cation diffusion facilitator CzcD-associated flavoprotein CzcO
MRCTFGSATLSPVSENCAIVGSGLAALTAKAALADAQVEALVFGDRADPAAAWRARAGAIRQTHMRSESDGHCRPRTFPGLAVRDTLRERDPWPLVLSVADRYRPSVDAFLADVDAVREDSAWDASFRHARIAEIRPIPGGFLLGHSSHVPGTCQVCARYEGPFKHVLVATGHPGLNMPPELTDDPRVVHSYEPHEYGEHVAVVGAGMAAATEWRNASAAGAEVTSVRRREPLRRPLNLPRHLFTKRGLAAYHRLDPRTRVSFLRELSAPSFPPGREWDVRVHVTEYVPDEVDQVICATGFVHGAQHEPLLASLPRHDGWIELSPDATVPSLTDDTRTLAVSGVHAQWAFPAADTLAGMRYVAHRFARRCRTR